MAKRESEAICLDESLPGFVWGTGGWAALPLLPLPTTLIDTEHYVSEKHAPQIYFIKITVCFGWHVYSHIWSLQMPVEIRSVWEEKLALALMPYFCAVENLTAFVLWWWEKIQDQMLSGKLIHGMQGGIKHCRLFISSEKRETDYIPKVHLLNWQLNTPGSYFHRNNQDLLAAFCVTKGFNELTWKPNYHLWK